MTSKKKLIFIIDALGADNIDRLKDFDFIKPLSVARVIPPFSFEPDAAFLTGQYPENSNSGLRVIKRMDRNVKRFPIPSWLEHLLFYNRYLRKAINKIIRFFFPLIFSRFKGNLAFIPFSVLNNFTVALEENLYEVDLNRNVLTIFDELALNGIDQRHIGSPLTSGRLDYLKTLPLKEIIETNDVISFFISDLDYVGHKYGPESPEAILKLEEILDFVRDTIDAYDSDFVLFGDHGMVNVEMHVDILEELNNLPLINGVDYLFFLDSTLARFWFNSQESREIITTALGSLDSGEWVSKLERQDYNISYEDNRFGDEIWWINGGGLIMPNFWQGNKALKGMHGYRKSVNSNHSVFFTNDRSIRYNNILQMNELHNLLHQFVLGHG